MEKNIAIEKLLKELEESRNRRASLSFAERRAEDIDEGVASLLAHNYITPDEAKQWKEPLQELPTDRKSLVIAYFLSGSFDANVLTTEDNSNMNDFIRQFRLFEKEKPLPLKDSLTKEELELFNTGSDDLLYTTALHRAEVFVDAKRKRLRAALLKCIRKYVAIALSLPPEDKELDSNPYVRDFAAERGYRPKAKSINQQDRDAIEEASTYYLNLIELAFLNGEYERRRLEVYPKYLSEDGSEWSDTFYYEDDIDEVLTTATEALYLFIKSIEHFYNDGTAKDMIDFVKSGVSKNFSYTADGAKETDNVEDDLLKGRLLNSKFKYLIEEGLC